MPLRIELYNQAERCDIGRNLFVFEPWYGIILMYQVDP